MPTEAERAETHKQMANLFEGAKGRQPKTDDELNEWLASPEGQVATALEPALIERWGTIGRA